jgi:N-acetylmuramoyl-L-alanine amidase
MTGASQGGKGRGLVRVFPGRGTPPEEMEDGKTEDRRLETEMSGGQQDRKCFAVCVGHARPGDTGAVACDDATTERCYNGHLGGLVVDALEEAGVPAVLIPQYQGRSYGEAMRWLRKELARVNATGAAELHFNAADPRARGHEWLYWHGSTEGRHLAQAIEWEMKKAFPLPPARGLKSIGPGQRGAQFLGGVIPPAVICEPFFGSNQADWEDVAGQPAKLAGVIARGITQWWKGMKG